MTSGISCGILIALFERSMKTVLMEKRLDDMAKALFGRGRKVAMDNQMCVMCGNDANHFTDELSRREYGISCMCQSCQDGVFKVDNED